MDAHQPQDEGGQGSDQEQHFQPATIVATGVAETKAPSGV